MPWLVVGLGNPGDRYAGNRHNAGFMVVDELARRYGQTFRTKFQARTTRIRVADQDVVLLQPMTYMNRSGPSVGEAARFYRVEPAQTVVIHDEIDLPFGELRFKVGGGHAGHNGLRSIFEHYPRDFVRLRFGVGRPGMGDVSGHVLGDFDAVERATLSDLVIRAADGIEIVLQEGPEHAMNAFHGKAGQA
jgi:PTH1 family peptidyl-tRNA hydrolase